MVFPQPTCQISVFLENRAGIVADLCSALTEKKINIIGMTVLDTIDIGTLRLVVDDVKGAKNVLKEVGAAYVEVPVVTVRIPNSPGAFARIARKFSDAGINIEYMYATALSGMEASLGVFRVSDAQAALDIEISS